MVTNRPMARLGIADLEEIFQKQGEDLTVLADLKHELSFRKVPRALALQELINKVRSNQEKGLKLKVIENTVTSSIGFVQTPPHPPNELDLPGDSSSAVNEPKQEPLTASNVAISIEPQSLPQLALDDACKILKVSIDDAWGKVELARRKIVQKSSPIATSDMSTEQINKLIAEAALANDAAIVIAARRSGYQ